MPLNFRIMSAAIIPLAILAASESQAQDPMMTDPVEDQNEPLEIDAVFQANDHDESQDLSLDEFIAFNVELASHGHKSARALIISGDYEGLFETMDQDQSGGLDLDEIVYPDESEDTKHLSKPDG